MSGPVYRLTAAGGRKMLRNIAGSYLRALNKGSPADAARALCVGTWTAAPRDRERALFDRLACRTAGPRDAESAARWTDDSFLRWIEQAAYTYKLDASDLRQLAMLAQQKQLPDAKHAGACALRPPSSKPASQPPLVVTVAGGSGSGHSAPLAPSRARLAHQGSYGEPVEPIIAPALARAFSANTRPHVRRTEDGDSLHFEAAASVALRMREPMLSTTIRARSSVPALQLYIDRSGSMGDLDGGGVRLMVRAAETASAIAGACRIARVPLQVIGFDDEPAMLADWTEQYDPRAYRTGSTELPKALLTCLPMLGLRHERRRIALVITDGYLGGEDDWRDGIRPLAQSLGVELYGITIGGAGAWPAWDPEHSLSWSGAIELSDPSDLAHVAARELAAVIGRGGDS